MKKRLVITSKVYVSGREHPYHDLCPHGIDVDMTLLDSLFIPSHIFDYWTPVPECMLDLDGEHISYVYRVLSEIRRRIHRRQKRLLTYYTEEEVSDVYSLVNIVGSLKVEYPGVNLYFRTTSLSYAMPNGVLVCSSRSLLM